VLPSIRGGHQRLHTGTKRSRRICMPCSARGGCWTRWCACPAPPRLG